MTDEYPGQAPCPHCFESSGYMGRVHPATWDDPAWEDADPTRPCAYCNGTGTVDSPLVTLDDLEALAADEAAEEQRLEAEAEERRRLENEEMDRHFEKHPHG